MVAACPTPSASMSAAIVRAKGPRKGRLGANKGGQFKFNITKELPNGYVPPCNKYLNGRAIGYLPNPVLVTGTDANPELSGIFPVSGITGDTLHSPLLPQECDAGRRQQSVTRSIRTASTRWFSRSGWKTSLPWQRLEPDGTVPLRRYFRWLHLAIPGIGQHHQFGRDVFGRRRCRGDPTPTDQRPGKVVPGSSYLAQIVLFDVS